MKPVDLLPVEYRTTGRHVPPPMRGYVVLGALLLVLVASAWHVSLARTVADRSAAAVRAEGDLALLQARATALDADRERAEAVQSRIAGVATLVKGRIAWDQTLTDLAATLPASAHLSSVEASARNADGGGSAVRSALDVPALVLAGCVERQADIPDLLSRLRDLPAAQRVVLGSSKSPDGDADDRSSCRRATAPTFEATVFITGPALPTTAAATPSSTPTPTPSPAR